MKILLLGVSCSGKSTIASDLATALKLRLLEADDEVLRLNGGVWPPDEETIDTYFGVTNKEVLKMDNIVYVISWLEQNDIFAFYKADFILVEIHASYEVLRKRKQARDNPAKQAEKRHQKNFKLYSEIVNDPNINKLLSVSLDTSELTLDEVLQAVLAKMKGEYLRDV
jgi:shikimate kinase